MATGTPIGEGFERMLQRSCVISADQGWRGSGPRRGFGRSCWKSLDVDGAWSWTQAKSRSWMWISCR
ncbi:hypothetical protein CASFOL_013746 [Castilleja foliolosa]|uniref:Uncharacterized protein n=1 Tax=Castilleja foliolosa TaxID=1961234 RepID=A0ABD3DMM6_9LAMI